MVIYISIAVIWISFLLFLWWAITKFMYNMWLLDIRKYADSQLAEFKEIHLVLSYKKDYTMRIENVDLLKALMHSFGASKVETKRVGNSWDPFTGTISGNFSNKEKFILFAKHARSHGIGVI